MNTHIYEVRRLSGISGCIVSTEQHETRAAAERVAKSVNDNGGAVVAKVFEVEPTKVKIDRAYAFGRDCKGRRDEFESLALELVANDSEMTRWPGLEAAIAEIRRFGRSEMSEVELRLAKVEIVASELVASRLLASVSVVELAEREMSCETEGTGDLDFALRPASLA